MESRVRSLAKALSWQSLGLVSTSLLGYAFTGSFLSGGGLALASCGLGFLTYMLHERIWAGIRWGIDSLSGERLEAGNATQASN